jgi:hypothetical protein
MENCTQTITSKEFIMNFETAATPWSYDELQLIGAELGDTVEFVDELGSANIGVIVLLNKMTIYLLTENKEIIKFGRVTLMSVDNQFEIVGLAKKQIRISAEEWKSAKESINVKPYKKEIM